MLSVKYCQVFMLTHSGTFLRRYFRIGSSSTLWKSLYSCKLLKDNCKRHFVKTLFIFKVFFMVFLKMPVCKGDLKLRKMSVCDSVQNVNSSRHDEFYSQFHACPLDNPRMYHMSREWVKFATVLGISGMTKPK